MSAESVRAATTGPRLLVCAPLRLEAAPLRRTLGADRVRRTGYGSRRNARAVSRLDLNSVDALAVAGLGGGCTDLIRPGDVVVADEVRTDGRTVRCPSAPLLVAALRRRGLTVHCGPIVTCDHVVRGAEYRRFAESGALAVDMESSVAAAAAEDAGLPFAAVRVIVDTPRDRLASARTVRRSLHSIAVLAPVGEALGEWASATGPHHALLAAPRSFCAGVERAIDIVERALTRYGSPVYVRKQIVHNAHVVHELEERGARFVDELDEVPEGATVVFSAHGVAPAVHREAASRTLDVVDATCPLVAKVHAEARRFAGRGDTVVLIGHAGHEEAEGTLGEAPERTVLVESVADVERLDVADPDRVAYLMQTTLSVEDSVEIVAALRRKFPRLGGPSSDDICYATSNRQRALADVASRSDVVLVVGSGNSSNSLRLVETAQRTGTTAYLVDGAEQVDPRWLDGVRTVGVSAGASAPSVLVEQVIDALAGLGPCTTDEHEFTTESVHFTLPKEVS